MRQMREKNILLASHGALIFAHKKGIKHLSDSDMIQHPNGQWCRHESAIYDTKTLWWKIIMALLMMLRSNKQCVRERMRCQKRIKRIWVERRKKQSDMKWNSLAVSNIKSSPFEKNHKNKEWWWRRSEWVRRCKSEEFHLIFQHTRESI